MFSSPLPYTKPQPPLIPPLPHLASIPYASHTSLHTAALCHESGPNLTFHGLTAQSYRYALPSPPGPATAPELARAVPISLSVPCGFSPLNSLSPVCFSKSSSAGFCPTANSPSCYLVSGSLPPLGSPTALCLLPALLMEMLLSSAGCANQLMTRAPPMAAQLHGREPRAPHTVGLQ